jgi:hypothetical protein
MPQWEGNLIRPKCLCAWLVLTIWANTASAVPVRWQFQDVLFSDGASLTGSFIFDTDAPTYPVPDSPDQVDGYSSVNISANASERFLFEWQADYAEECKSEDCGYSGANRLYTVPVSGDCGFETTVCQRNLGIQFDRSLNSTGSPIAVSGYEYYDVRTPGGGTNWGDRRIVSGYVIGTVVPLPAAIWAFGSGLVALGWMRRRNSA